MVHNSRFFEFDIVHRPGVHHANADTLSRPVVERLNHLAVTLSSEVTNDIHFDDHLKSFVTRGVQVQSRLDESCAGLLITSKRLANFGIARISLVRFGELFLLRPNG